MLSQDEALIRATWAVARIEAPAIEAAFLQRVCTQAPRLCNALRALPPPALDAHVQAFVGSAVALLDEPRHLVHFLKESARRFGIGNSGTDYLLLGTCFFDALADVLGPRLDGAARAAWLEATTLLAALLERVSSA